MGGRPSALVALALLSTPGCIGSGSEIGPLLSEVPPVSASAAVLDPEGNVVSDAVVRLDGNDVTFTDRRGRFRFYKNPGENGAVFTIDARRTTTRTVPAGVFDRITVRLAFKGDQGI